MPKFIIHWDAGCGENNALVECEDLAEAKKLAEEAWREEAESNAQFGADPLTKETAEEYGFEEELGEEESSNAH